MSLIYITRDIERAASLLTTHPEIMIISNQSVLANMLKKRFPVRIFIYDTGILPTLELIRDTSVQSFISQKALETTPQVIVFKNSPLIEQECKKLNWELLNPPAELSAKIENKISQYNWIKKNTSLGIASPKTIIGLANQFTFEDLAKKLGRPFILQYNIGHTGAGTKIIANTLEWESELRKFSKREVRASEYIKGKIYTVNACVIENKVICGRTSEQMTGIEWLTKNQFATVGNNWGVSEEIHNKVAAIAEGIGRQLRKEGWKGLFGIDVILTDEGGHPGYLIEINARQPASATLESQLQKERGETSIMDRHVRTLIGEESGIWNLESGSKITNKFEIPFKGFQLFFRNIGAHPVKLKKEFGPGRYKVDKQGIEFIAPAASIHDVGENEIFAFSVSSRDLIKTGGELLRIQSKNGMVDTLGKNWEKVLQAIRKQIELT